MRTTRAGADVRRRGRGRFGRDLLLALGLVGIGVGGLGLLVKTAHVAVAVVVGLCVLGALVAGLAAARRRAVFAGAPEGAPSVPPPATAEVPGLGSEALDHAAVDADGFEHTVAALCARDGCTAVEVVGGAGDLGADVLAVTADGRRLVLQCKHYAQDNRVGSQDLQRFGGTCFTVHEADVAIVVTTSSFTAPAAEYAAMCGIVCLDGDALAAWTDQTTPPPWDVPATEPADTVPAARRPTTPGQPRSAAVTSEP
ncbi:restriction endonuclease [Streptomyces roseolus]|uniref:restriction endonuclease n=1 Tax=Streptomyces roseolus TaxID=67358 RepID=UPI0036E0EC71